MYQVSETLAGALRDAHTIAISVDGVEIPSRDVVRVVHSAALCGGEIGIGGVNAACVEVTLSAKYDLSGKTLDIRIGAGEPLEWMPLGVFAVVDTAQTDSGTTATAYDAAYYATGRGYSPTVSSEVTVAAVAADVCRQCGITLGTLPAAAQTTPVTGTLTGHSCRDMIGYLAGLLGRNALISRDNRLEFRWLAQLGRTISPAEYYSGKLSQSDVFEVVGVQCDKKTTKTVTDPETGTKTETDETVTLTSGGGNGKIIKFDNPYMTQSILDSVCNGITGLRFHTGGFSAVHGILTEPGDVITVTALDGAVYIVPALAVRLELDGGCRLTVDAPGTSTVTDNAQFVSAHDKALDALAADIGRFKRLYAENIEAENAYVKKLNAEKATVGELEVVAESTAELKVGLDGVSSKVGGFDERIARAESTVSQTAEAITAEVSRAETAEGALRASIRQTADSITLDVSRSAAVGNRNLFSGADGNTTGATQPQYSVVVDRVVKKDEVITLSPYSGGGCIAQFSNCLTFDPSEALGEQITISVEVRVNKKTKIYARNTSGNPRYFYFSEIIGEADTTWKRIVFQTSVKEHQGGGASENPSTWRRFELYAPDSASVTVRNIKVEFGNIATDWTPAPEDTDERVEDAEASIKLTSEAIEAEVRRATAAEGELKSSIKQTADSITAEVTRATAAEGELKSSIKQTADAITSTVKKGEIISTINQTAESVKIEAEKIDLVGKVTAKELAAGSVTADKLSVTDAMVEELLAKNITATGKVQFENDAYHIRFCSDSALGTGIDIGRGDSDKPGYALIQMYDSAMVIGAYSNINVIGTATFYSTIKGDISGNAATATRASTAAKADNANYATSAGSANSATSATSAGKATNNSTGFNIPEIQTGTVSITPSAANTPTAKAVNFAKSFTGTPIVTVTPSTGAPGTIVTGTAALSPSKSSFTAYLTRTNTTSTSLYWIAVY